MRRRAHCFLDPSHLHAHAPSQVEDCVWLSHSFSISRSPQGTNLCIDRLHAKMAKLLSLPVELLQQIIELANPAQANHVNAGWQPPFSKPKNGGSKYAELLNIILVCKIFHGICEPLLYSKLKYLIIVNGNPENGYPFELVLTRTGDRISSPPLPLLRKYQKFVQYVLENLIETKFVY